MTKSERLLREECGDCKAEHCVAELGEMLPHECTSSKRHDWKDWECSTYSHKYVENVSLIQFSAKTEADARAKMLIYLLENNLVKPGTAGRDE